MRLRYLAYLMATFGLMSLSATEQPSESAEQLIALHDTNGGGGSAMDPIPNDSPQHITFRHTEFNGVGHDNGYTSIDFFMAPFGEPRGIMPFVDMRGHVLNNGDIAANIGFGFRRQPADGDCVWGFNLFYDWRERPDFSFHAHQFHQVGVGFEIFCPHFDLRLNGYIPVGRNLSKEVHFHSFEGNNLNVLQRTAMGMPGVEVDVGSSLGEWGGIDWYLGMTPYFFWGKDEGHYEYGDDVYGFAFRIVAQFWKSFGLTVGASIDSVFDFNGLVELAFRIPPSQAAPREGRSSFAGAGSPTPYDRMGQRVQRRDLIVIQGKSKVRRALRQTDCEDYKVYHVSNTGVSGNKFSRCGIDGPAKADNMAADGSWEHPFTTLAEAEAASSASDIIYVLAGDGSNTGMAAGVTLKNYQQLLGGGKDHLVNSCQGKVVLPAVCPGFFPKITNAGNGVTLASYNTVAGVWVDGATDGIVGTSGTDSKILCNKVTNSTNNGIFLTNYSGDLWVDDNWVDASGNNGMEFVNAVAGNSNYHVMRNHVNDSTVDGINFAASSTSSQVTHVGWNIISGNAGSGQGLQMTLSDNAKAEGYFYKNKIQGTSAEAIEVVMNNGSTGCFDLFCNQITSMNDDGIRFDLNDSASISQAMIRNNTIDDFATPGESGIDIDLAGSSTATFCIANNCVRGNSSGAALEAIAADSARLQMVVDDNDFTNLGGRAVNVEGSGSSFIAAAFGHNRMTGSWWGSTSGTSRLDIQLIGNNAPGYTVENVAGTINFENTESRNEGPFTFTGTVTTVSENSLNLRKVCRGGKCCP